jgi:hypothetical protein
MRTSPLWTHMPHPRKRRGRDEKEASSLLTSGVGKYLPRPPPVLHGPDFFFDRHGMFLVTSTVPLGAFGNPHESTMSIAFLTTIDSLRASSPK